MEEGRETAMEEGRDNAAREEEIRMDPRLYKAAMNGNVEELVSLHKCNSKILTQCTLTGNTALHIAASYDRFHFVRKFVELYKADNGAQSKILKDKNMVGNTALHEACSRGKLIVVYILLREVSELAHIKNLKGETPLFKAAENGHTKIVEQLLPGTPPDCLKRRDGQTPLHVAVRKSHEGVIQVLLNPKPEVAKEVDCPSGYWLRKLNAHNIGKTRISKDGLSCSTKDKNGETPFHIAVQEGNSGLTEDILMYDPNCIEMLDGDSRTVLHLAVEHATHIYGRSRSDLQRIMACVTVPTIINYPDKNGNTALAIAMKKGVEDPHLYTAIKGFLLSRGASPPEAAHEEAKKPSDTTQDASGDESITVNISLMATIAFAVAFTLPGKGGDSFRNHFLFNLLVITDTIAFCCSLGVALVLVYVRGNPDFSIWAHISAAISVAGASLALTFGAAVHIAVGSRFLWLPVIVWVMVLIMIYISIHKSKLLLFMEKLKLLEIIVHPAKLVAADLLTFLLTILNGIAKAFSFFKSLVCSFFKSFGTYV